MIYNFPTTIKDEFIYTITYAKQGVKKEEQNPITSSGSKVILYIGLFLLLLALGFCAWRYK